MIVARVCDNLRGVFCCSSLGTCVNHRSLCETIAGYYPTLRLINMHNGFSVLSQSRAHEWREYRCHGNACMCNGRLRVVWQVVANGAQKFREHLGGQFGIGKGRIRRCKRRQQTHFSVFFVRNGFVLTHVACALKAAHLPMRVRTRTLSLLSCVLLLRIRVALGAC